MEVIQQPLYTYIQYTLYVTSLTVYPNPTIHSTLYSIPYVSSFLRENIRDKCLIPLHSTLLLMCLVFFERTNVLYLTCLVTSQLYYPNSHVPNLSSPFSPLLRTTTRVLYILTYMNKITTPLTCIGIYIPQTNATWCKIDRVKG